MAARRKAEGGLTEVLYVRVGRDLLERIDRELEARRSEKTRTRADLVREMLEQALDLERGRQA